MNDTSLQNLRNAIFERGVIPEFGGRPDGHILQNADELAALLTWYESLGLPHKYLEIGVQYGGLMKFMMDRGYESYGIDPVVPIHVPSDMVHRGKSQDAASIEYASRHARYGFVFIDGDHEYESVKEDWRIYSRMAKVVAFHDVCGKRECDGAKRFWDELDGDKHEFIADHAEYRCGIGAIVL